MREDENESWKPQFVPKKHIYSTSSEAFLTSTRHHQSWVWDKNHERHTNATLQNLNTKQSRMSDSVINWLISVLEKKKDFFQAGLNKVLWWCNLPASRHHELHVQHSWIKTRSQGSFGTWSTVQNLADKLMEIKARNFASYFARGHTHNSHVWEENWASPIVKCLERFKRYFSA